MTVTAERTAQQRWAEEFRRVSNQDTELRTHGTYYTCSFMIDMTDHQYVLRVNRGQVEDITVDPGPLDEPYQFAIRASADTWRKFSQEVPEPMYHGIFAMTFRRDMHLDGDLLVLMQNLRCVVTHLELMRTIAAPA